MSNANTACTSGSYTKLYWRSLSNDTIAETDGSGSTTNSAYNEYAFFAGRRIASRNGAGAIFYYFADQLGSTRTITTGNGTGQTSGQLCYDQDYTPYGQEVFTTAQMSRLQTTACPPNYRFTGYEYDSETGLNYAFARYYSPRLGRFMSTDPLRGSIGSLQSHHAYAYVINNPSNLSDPSGMDGRCKTAVNCPSAGGGSGPIGGCSLDGVDTSCGLIYRLAGMGALAGASAPFSGGGQLLLYLAGGSVTSINHNDWGGMMDYANMSYGFDGEWVTINQFVGLVDSYYAGLGNLSDDERLSIVARGVVKGAGGLGDWRFYAGFYLASLAGATPQILNSVASLDSVSIAVGEGQPFHVAVGADGQWIHATDMYGEMQMTTEGANAYVRGFAWGQVNVPTLAPQAIFGTEGSATSSCVSGACSALWKTVF